MLKILFIYLGQQGGGNSIQFLEYAKGLSHFSQVLCVISNKSDEFKIWEDEAERNLNMRVLGVTTTKNVFRGGIEILNFFKFHIIRNRINIFAPDAIYSVMDHPWERLIVPYLKCKFTIQSVHDVKHHQGENTFLAKFVKFLFSYESTKYVVFSDFSKKELAKSVDEDRIWTLPLGCTNSLSHKRELDLKFYGRILFFGRLIEYKGIDILLNSLNMVLQKCPTMKLVLAGRGDLSKYQYLIEKYKDNSELHNEWILNEDIDNYFRNVDFVVAPYIDATQSGVVPLSYVFGKPVIASNSGGLPEQIVEGKTGSVVAMGDVQALSDAIVDFYSDKSALEKKKECAFMMSKTLTWEYTAEMLYNYIKDSI